MTNRRLAKPLVWITWERQRRSLSLAGLLHAELFIITSARGRLARYISCSLRTLSVLWSARGGLVFVQCPSMALAVLACVLRPLLRYRLVVDRHSNFLLGSRPPYRWKERVFFRVSDWTLRRAELTIVTNEAIAQRVRASGGRSFILPDPFPQLTPSGALAAKSDKLKVLFVSSWSGDEPIEELLVACECLLNDVEVFISGRPKREWSERLRTKPANVTITGFLSDADYVSLLASVDAVVAITKLPQILVCGAYEAYALGKPVMLGDSRELCEYFSHGAVYVDSSVEQIREGLLEMRARILPLTHEAEEFYRVAKVQWEGRFAMLCKDLDLPAPFVA